MAANRDGLGLLHHGSYSSSHKSNHHRHGHSSHFRPHGRTSIAASGDTIRLEGRPCTNIHAAPTIDRGLSGASRNSWQLGLDFVAVRFGLRLDAPLLLVAKERVTIAGFVAGLSYPDRFGAVLGLAPQTQTIRVVVAPFVVPLAGITAVVASLFLHFAAIPVTIGVLAANGALVNDEFATGWIGKATAAVALEIGVAGILLLFESFAGPAVAPALETVFVDRAPCFSGLVLELADPAAAPAALAGFVDQAGGGVGSFRFTDPVAVAKAALALKVGSAGEILSAVSSSSGEEKKGRKE